MSATRTRMPVTPPPVVEPLRFSVELPGSVPTDNTLYCNIPGKGRVLTGVARAWKASAVIVIQAAAAQAGWSAGPKTPLAVELTFGLPQLFVRDVGNMQKLIGDALAEAIQVDDRYFVDLYLRKRLHAEAATLIVVSKVTIE